MLQTTGMSRKVRKYHSLNNNTIQSLNEWSVRKYIKADASLYRNAFTNVVAECKFLLLLDNHG